MSKQLTIRDRLDSPEFASEIARVLPRHITPERMIRVAITAIMRTPKLRECDQASFFNAMLQLSQWGLEPDGRRAHLIPFENRKRRVIECQLILDYKGIVELALRSGNIAKIHCDKVCENDEFEYDCGEVVRHKIDFRKPRGDAYAYVCIITRKDGSRKCEVMSREEVDNIRARSKSANNGPWVTDYDEMAKKGLALDTPIPTPGGWTTMGEIATGDTVFDIHGNQTTVIATSEVKHLPCFRVTFQDGESIICDDEHRWVATVGTNGSRDRKNGWPVFTVNDLYEAKRSGKIVSMPVAGSIDCGWIDLPVHPWVLGYWLGNGKARDGNVTCHREDRDEITSRIESLGYSLGAVRDDSRSLATSVAAKGLKVQLREAGVLNNKAIPPIYLRGSLSQRIDLLCGLMDSDGHIDKSRGRAIFTSTARGLAEGVMELVSSIGEKAAISMRRQRGYGKEVDCYRVEWSPVLCPCTLGRKSANFRPRRVGLYRGVKSIERIDSVPTRCIAVDSESKTYLAGRSMIPTHNTVFKRASKWIELSPEIRDAIEVDDRDFIAGRVTARSVEPAGDDLQSLLSGPGSPAIEQQDSEPDWDAELESATSQAALESLRSRVVADCEDEADASTLINEIDDRLAAMTAEQ